MFAPGRVNLLGEHVDHQQGVVLPMALREGVAVAWGRRPDRAVRLLTLDPPCVDRFVIGEAVKSGRRPADLVRGTCAALEGRGLRIPGLDLAVAADLPTGKGLGSSGAFVVAVAKAFLQAGASTMAPRELARLAAEVEEKWAGVPCGVMDPYVSAIGRRGVPLAVDCRSIAHQELPLPAGVEAAWVDTGVVRRLSETPYGERRREVERGVAHLRVARPELASLRDLWPSAYASLEAGLPEPERRRCRHVVGEMDRVGRAVDALRAGDAAALGALLDEGHRSLSQDFECSTPEIDARVATERAKPDVLGVRLQGAGWGGSLVVLRKRSAT